MPTIETAVVALHKSLAESVRVIWLPKDKPSSTECLL